MNETSRINAAADWLPRLQSDTASDETIRSWVQWCEADIRNEQAFYQVRELLQIADGLAGEVVNGELIGADASTPSQNAQPAWRALLQHPLRALAASLVIMAIAAIVWVMRVDAGHMPVRNGAVLASSAPMRTAMLPDGSRVDLASKSTVAVHYTVDTRALELRDGEAFFSVTPNKHRPFIVTAAGVSVRAVGTAFNVRRAAGRVVVTVTEGTVDIYQEGRRSVALRASAGFQVAWHGDQVPSGAAATSDDPVMTAVNPATAVGWREGCLEYLDEPLEAVIADINRYSSRPVIIADEPARKLRFSGTVMVGFTDDWLSALPGQFPVKLRSQNGVDVIHSVASDLAR